jgi:hypothetical protein
MNLRRILAILVKDLRDAWRDGRIVVLLLMPIGIALIPTVGGTDERPSTDVVVVDQARSGVAAQLRQVAEKGIDVKLTETRDVAAARRRVAEEEDEVAVVVGPATTRSGTPRAEILLGASASPAAQSIVALVPDALTRAAGGEPAARPALRVIAPANRKPSDVVGSAALTALFSIVTLVTFVALMVVPMQTAEEFETGTFGALRLAATGPEILSAKALTGYVFGMAGVGLTVVLTGLDVHHPVLFFGAAFALIVCLVGFGLLLGLVIPNANAINSYAAFLLAPLIGSSIAIYFVDSGAVATLLDALPFSQAAKLLADGVSGQAPFDAGPVAWLVITAWAIVGYTALMRIVARREI